MAGKVLINLSTGLEDPERVTVAFLVGGAAVARGDNVAIWMAGGSPTCASRSCTFGVACEGCPPLAKLFEQFADGGGELLVCPICFTARQLDQGSLVPNARIAGATPMFEWIGDDHATVFSY